MAPPRLCGKVTRKRDKRRPPIDRRRSGSVASGHRRGLPRDAAGQVRTDSKRALDRAGAAAAPAAARNAGQRRGRGSKMAAQRATLSQAQRRRLGR